MIQSNVYVGIKPSFNKVDESFYDETYSSIPTVNFDYVLLPITNQRYSQIAIKAVENYRLSQKESYNLFSELTIPEPKLQDLYIPPFKSKASLNGSDGQYIMHLGLLASWLDLDSMDPVISDFSYKVLLNECKYARFVGIRKLLVAPPRDLSNLTPYSQTINRLLNHEVLTMEPKITLSISLPLVEDSEPFATWELWNTVRKICEYNELLTISLALPRIKTPSYVLKRWLCEPVSCLLISSSIFETNQNNYPVLHKFNQKILREFQRINGNSQSEQGQLCVILHGMEKHADFIRGGSVSYLDYINFLLKKEDKLIMDEFNKEAINMTNEQGSSNANLINEDKWLPKLMPPLLPNSDNLTNDTYLVFENDRTKYDLYHEAIHQAIHDKLSYIQHLKRNNSQKFQILVAGAGRGPLIDETYDILKYYNVLNKCKIIAIEKNSQAFLFLQKKKFDKWVDSVELIRCDMKKLSNDFGKFDIVISELLGSFGCNELSPECLIHIEANFSRKETIFIPESYSSYVAPASLPLVRQKLDKFSNGFEKPWLVNNIPYCILSTKINKIWSFQHPLLKTENQDNKHLFNKNIENGEFKLKHKCEIDGLIGFFSATLYNNITLSTLPEGFTINDPRKEYDTKITTNDKNESIHTKNLKSWAPIFFPITSPLSITDDTELSVYFNRISDSQLKKTWYEWSLESFIYLVVSSTSHKQNGNTTVASKSIHNQASLNELRETTTIKDEQSLMELNGSEEVQPQPTQQESNRNYYYQSEFETGGWESVNDIHELTSDMSRLNTDNTNEENKISATFDLKVSPTHGRHNQPSLIEVQSIDEDSPENLDYSYELEEDFKAMRTNNNDISTLNDDTMDHDNSSHKTTNKNMNTTANTKTSRDINTNNTSNNQLEVNLRIRTGVTKLHNMNGNKSSIPY
ncbi:hypothetical protein TPHA_0A02440 [Tetrapisispora phaffii CBS 4417]|uniref:Protein arginine N-methyltransferase n=1 Tax=Tetrapisispora phaffii (strain ATCC 24235 / CBS 4417 / NBRC 1672 / NRRL Y-8282 / UCD 70-5) TaxID=1071381 RepID=G8BN49_TETPH|nr:hypothetical protein TPHA_0A02440 [Tetrapisispora phaffii CBS 4417]CCE61327.1 hypothetical protein TPHA_0A02440 [Tetrapisispora phaffii CBS 4417]